MTVENQVFCQFLVLCGHSLVLLQVWGELQHTDGKDNWKQQYKTQLWEEELSFFFDLLSKADEDERPTAAAHGADGHHCLLSVSLCEFFIWKC